MYPLIPFIIIFIIAVVASLTATTNSTPFKTEQAREIWQNMTKFERTAANRKSRRFGAFVGAILGIVPGVIGLTLGIALLGSALKGVIISSLLSTPIVLLVIWKVYLPHMAESWRLFFASTEWAINHDIQPEDIRLFKWEI
ncbi:MAG: hypothetical protein JXA96_08275 [Sedimentisphaerales bacterium]|nr:hypothetical protein [Sedimentisphaerales bacterium]